MQQDNLPHGMTLAMKQRMMAVIALFSLGECDLGTCATRIFEVVRAHGGVEKRHDLTARARSAAAVTRMVELEAENRQLKALHPASGAEAQRGLNDTWPGDMIS